jgi:integrating conjugative element membrane protein (TIGR03747 family)
VPGAFLWPARVVVVTVLVFAGLWLFAVTVQTALAVRAVGAAGAAQRIETVLDGDLALLHTLPPGPLSPMRIGIGLATTIHDFTFGAILSATRSVMNMPDRWQRFARPEPHPDLGAAYLDQQVFPQYVDYIRAAAAGNLVFSLRTALLLSAAPLAALLYLVAVADGLTARAIRRACAGRESSGVYHRAKLAQVYVLAGAWMLYVCWPATIDPVLFALATAATLAVLARTQAAWTKKYI